MNGGIVGKRIREAMPFRLELGDLLAHVPQVNGALELDWIGVVGGVRLVVNDAELDTFISEPVKPNVMLFEHQIPSPVRMVRFRVKDERGCLTQIRFRSGLVLDATMLEDVEPTDSCVHGMVDVVLERVETIGE